jgi:hypothetical protein
VSPALMTTVPQPANREGAQQRWRWAPPCKCSVAVQAASFALLHVCKRWQAVLTSTHPVRLRWESGTLGPQRRPAGRRLHAS